MIDNPEMAIQAHTHQLQSGLLVRVGEERLNQCSTANVCECLSNKHKMLLDFNKKTTKTVD